MRGIVLVAADFAPSTALGMVAEELRSRGESATFISGKGEIVLPEDTTVVIAGMAHSPEMAQGELGALRQAVRKGIPIGLYADTFDCAGREWFAEARKNTQFLIVPTEKEKTKALELFPRANIVATGNPLWEASVFPESTRAEVRKRISMTEDQIVIFCPLRKESHINREHLWLVRQALERIDNEKILVVVTGHPGDETYKENPDAYRPLFPANAIQLVGTTLVKELLPGTDVVIGAGSGAGIDAIYQRVPVIDVMTELVLNEVERLHRRRVWQPVEDGSSIGIKNVEELVSALEQVTSGAGKDRLLAAQEKAYPRPTHPKQAVHAMVAEIQEWI
ncbi:MAG: hypothetical protein A3C70_01540 [Candidatus Zambryskibacteria bacterium RIFCSPHIGHO2_02_FULL_43_14]|uniref:UDP-N-acetylglucosamine 2-epimerase domain-containing protein n=1 Tax=Candidatus Zambryskibacteria bacterium RIFCSPHIGHO2_02_FULL_43_14 TaxID=1802748 RepID=A0A1G2TFY5_9BACT|nr:MAG: hypothetical protein A2829_03435 [Candidatus Zambryskibacteria bacterium RIFCSPHIGHO2_01_FULL_43_60]OHA96190.1 MAG: hypothetical protein A3C70_01540 [Candidatus Zambryskibacteria bacterium RIFCSPHIGHO2_02_FULL_43_14]OHB03841.1 MAG: hypothetical protein A3B03_03540 [Candidatus Zambryskibacteria bacterium RIFCSPLOWO2_01_FULL_42_41]